MTESPEGSTGVAPRRRRWVLASGVGLAAAVMTLVVGELMLRLYVWSRGWTPNCYAASLELFRPEPALGYDLRPNFYMRSGVYEIGINSRGLRGPEIADKRPGRQRIALLGGSAAFGYLVPDGAEAARIVEAELCRRGFDAQVLNAGAPGYNLFQTIERFRRLVAPLEPDVVVLYLGWNDLTYVVSNEPQDERFRVRPVAPTWERWLGRSTLYGFTAYRLLGAPVRLAPPQWASVEVTDAGAECFRRNLAELAGAIKETGAQMLVCAPASAAHPQVADSLRAALTHEVRDATAVVRLGQWLHDELAAFARRHNAEFLDVYEAIPPTEEYLGDYIHLTAVGERRLAQLLVERLAPVLKSRLQ